MGMSGIKGSGRGPNGSGSLRPDGYRQTREVDHPLASSNGIVYEHRKVLYDSIGPGPHPCHWCERPLDWGGPAGLQTDHLNNDRGDNRLENLVPSCPGCNSGRAEGNGGAYNKLKTHCPQGHPYDEANTGRRKGGRRYCRICHRSQRAEWGRKNVEYIAAKNREYRASRKEQVDG